jgi:hypothetical protein
MRNKARWSLRGAGGLGICGAVQLHRHRGEYVSRGTTRLGVVWIFRAGDTLGGLPFLLSRFRGFL